MTTYMKFVIWGWLITTIGLGFLFDSESFVFKTVTFIILLIVFSYLLLWGVVIDMQEKIKQLECEIRELINK